MVTKGDSVLRGGHAKNVHTVPFVTNQRLADFRYDFVTSHLRQVSPLRSLLDL